MKKYKNRATFEFYPAQNGMSAFWRQISCTLGAVDGLTLLPFLRALFLDQAPEIYNIVSCVGFRSLYFRGIRIKSSFDCLTIDFNL